MKRLLQLAALVPVSIAFLAPSAQAAAVRLGATLAGAAVLPNGEKPLGGDPDGFGELKIEINTESGYTCYSLTMQNVKPRGTGGIFQGTPDQVGALQLRLYVTGTGEMCGPLDKTMLDRIIADPSGFYVSVSTRGYPGGAIRGQLARK